MDISVLMSTRNRAQRLRDTLEHFQRLSIANHDWEIVVVDNGSSDETQRVLAGAGRHLPLRVLSEPRAGKNRALNLALREAAGGLLVFTDDDIIPDPGWLQAIWDAAQRWPGFGVFGGRVLPECPTTTPEWLRQHPFAVTAFCVFDPPLQEGAIELYPFGANLAIRKDAMKGLQFREDVGPAGSSYAMGSETELLERLRVKGERFIFTPSAVVRHVIEEHQLDWKWLFARSRKYGRGQVMRAAEPPTAKWLFGAPRYYWRMWVSRGARYMASWMCSDLARFERGLEYHFVCGCIQQHRLNARSARSGAVAF